MELFSEEYLAHHGILGMKWGVRRYQNTDGTLTDAGKKRYRTDAGGSKSDTYNGAMSSGMQAIANRLSDAWSSTTVNQVVRNRSMAVHINRGLSAAQDVSSAIFDNRAQSAQKALHDWTHNKNDHRTEMQVLNDAHVTGYGWAQNRLWEQAKQKEIDAARNETFLQALRNSMDFKYISSNDPRKGVTGGLAYQNANRYSTYSRSPGENRPYGLATRSYTTYSSALRSKALNYGKRLMETLNNSNYFTSSYYMR